MFLGGGPTLDMLEVVSCLAATKSAVTLGQKKLRTSYNATEDPKDLIRKNNEHIQDIYRTKRITD